MDPPLLPPARLARSVLHTESDERLAELARAGSEAGFEALVVRHRRSLVRHCARILGEGDAEEAVQEALVRAHAALLRGDPVHRLGPWLHAIARNTALNLRRSRAAREPLAAEDSAQYACHDHVLEQRLELRELVDAVGSLPTRQREAIVMREFEGRSYVEIADRIGTSPGAVRQLLNRARTTVRRRLAALLPWGSLGRWLPDAGGGAVGSRLGAVPEACAATVKLCTVVLPVAVGFGAGGATPAPVPPVPALHSTRAAAHSTRPREAARENDHYGRILATHPVAAPATRVRPVNRLPTTTRPCRQAVARRATPQPKPTGTETATGPAAGTARPMATPGPARAAAPMHTANAPAPATTSAPATTTTPAATTATTAPSASADPAAPATLRTSTANMVQPPSEDQRGAPP